MAASWLKGYRQGSFRGVEFFIRSASNSGGRRHATHIFPGRDDVQHEDLGRKERKFSFTAYVVEDNYFQHREDLVKALETKGSGKLIHPYRGEFEVVCDSFSMTESTSEGRVARFDLSFLEEKEESLTVVSDNTQAKAYEAKKSFLDSLAAWLEDVYNIVRTPVAAIEDVTAALQDGLDVVQAVKKVTGVSAEFQKALSNMNGKIVALRTNAAIIASDFENLIQFGTDVDPRDSFIATADNSVSQIREALRMFEIRDSIDTTKDSDYPATLVTNTIAYNAIGSAVGLATVTNYGSLDEALETQENILSLIDSVLQNDDISDDMYQSLRACRAAVVNDIESRSADLPRLVDFTVTNTVNALYLSSEIYGNIDEVIGIVAENNIVHPGFITPASTIRIKTDD